MRRKVETIQTVTHRKENTVNSRYITKPINSLYNPVLSKGSPKGSPKGSSKDLHERLPRCRGSGGSSYASYISSEVGPGFDYIQPLCSKMSSSSLIKLLYLFVSCDTGFCKAIPLEFLDCARCSSYYTVLSGSEKVLIIS